MTLDEKVVRSFQPLPREVCLKSVNLDRVKEFMVSQAMIKEAQAKPLPGPSGDAFAQGVIKAAGKIVRRVVPVHFAVLQALNSPLLKMMERAAIEKQSESEFNDEQQIQVCHVFTANPRELRIKLRNEGVESIKKDADLACGEWSAAEINAVMLAVIEQLKRHVETTVRFAAEMEASGDVTFFQDSSPSQSKP